MAKNKHLLLLLFVAPSMASAMEQKRTKRWFPNPGIEPGSSRWKRDILADGLIRMIWLMERREIKIYITGVIIFQRMMKVVASSNVGSSGLAGKWGYRTWYRLLSSTNTCSQLSRRHWVEAIEQHDSLTVSNRRTAVVPMRIISNQSHHSQVEEISFMCATHIIQSKEQWAKATQCK